MLKPILNYHSKNPQALKNDAKFTLPVLYKWSKKAWMTTHLLTAWFAEYFKTTVETLLLKGGKKTDSFQNITAHW